MTTARWLALTLLLAGCGEPVETVVARVCVPGGPSTCKGGNVVKCTSDGRGWAVTKICGYGQACADGACTKSGETPYGGKDAGGQDASADGD